MKIIVVGSGYIGLVQAAICSEYGHEVYAYDTDRDKIKAYATGEPRDIEKYVYEPGLTNAIREMLNRYLFFTDKLTGVIETAEVIFFCVPTPLEPDGSTNLAAYRKAVENVAKHLAKRSGERRVVLVNKGTLPIGTVRYLEELAQQHGVKNFGVAANPEFLSEGTAVSQARRPDRVVVGCDTEEDFKLLRRVYSQFVNHVRIKYIETTPETAEAIKFTANAMLLTYISFWNGVGARIGERFPNVKIGDLRRGVTADERISTWGSYVSNGAGGRNFSQDIRSIIYQLKKANIDTRILEASLEINQYQKSYLVRRAIEEANFSFRGKTIALLGLAFKKLTNDISDASAIKAIELLLKEGVQKIKAYDPLAIGEARKMFDPAWNPDYARIEYFDSPEAAIEESDGLFISTDWEEFRGISAFIERTVPPPYLIIDGRRMIPDYKALVEKGYTYLAVGSPLMTPGERGWGKGKR